MQPAVVLVIVKDLLIQRASLLVRDRLEINAVEILKRRKDIPIKARGAGILKVAFRL